MTQDESNQRQPWAARSSETEISVSSGVTLLHHECEKSRGGWSAPEVLDRHGLVFVRRGGFHRRLDGREAFAGPAMAYFEMGGSEMQVAHPGADGDATSVYFFDDDAVDRLCGGDELPHTPIVVGADVDLAQRRLAAVAEHGADRLAVDEQVTRLVAAVIERISPGRMARQRANTQREHERITQFVTEAVTADPAAADLRTISSALGYSPYHVCRIFHERASMTLTRFRNRVRMSIAIDRLAQGESDLAGLAVELGFHDQAHMTRMLRGEAGETPGRIRAVLGARTNTA